MLPATVATRPLHALASCNVVLPGPNNGARRFPRRPDREARWTLRTALLAPDQRDFALTSVDNSGLELRESDSQDAEEVEGGVSGDGSEQSTANKEPAQRKAYGRNHEELDDGLLQTGRRRLPGHSDRDDVDDVDEAQRERRPRISADRAPRSVSHAVTE